MSPTLERMLIELALGDDAYPVNDALELEFVAGGSGRRRDTTADRAADLLAATSALQYLRDCPRDRRARGRSG